MSCTKCAKRVKLMGRTFQRLIKAMPNSSTSAITVNKRDCKIRTNITAEGYVASCTKCGAKGVPSPVPETASLECKKATNE